MNRLKRVRQTPHMIDIEAGTTSTERVLNPDSRFAQTPCGGVDQWTSFSLSQADSQFQRWKPKNESSSTRQISESPLVLIVHKNLSANGVRGSFAGPLVKSTYVKLTGNAQTAQLASSLLILAD